MLAITSAWECTMGERTVSFVRNGDVPPRSGYGFIAAVIIVAVFVVILSVTFVDILPIITSYPGG